VHVTSVHVLLGFELGVRVADILVHRTSAAAYAGRVKTLLINYNCISDGTDRWTDGYH